MAEAARVGVSKAVAFMAAWASTGEVAFMVTDATRPWGTAQV